MSELERFKQTYFQECAELLEELEDQLNLAKDEGGSSDIANAIFRAVHSIKGGGGAFGFTDLVDFSHFFESVLDRVRDGEIAFTDQVADVCLRCSDALADLVTVARDGGSADTASVARARAELAELNGGDDGEPAALGQDFDDLDFTPVCVFADDGDEPDLPSDLPPDLAPDLTVDLAGKATDDSLDTARDVGPDAADPTPGVDQNSGPGEIGEAGPPDAHQQDDWYIEFRPFPSLIDRGIEPVLLFRELAQHGEMQVRCVMDPPKSLADFDPVDIYLAFQIALAGGVEREKIDEAFEFAIGDCELSVQRGVANAPRGNTAQEAATASTMGEIIGGEIIGGQIIGDQTTEAQTTGGQTTGSQDTGALDPDNGDAGGDPGADHAGSAHSPGEGVPSLTDMLDAAMAARSGDVAQANALHDAAAAVAAGANAVPPVLGQPDSAASAEGKAGASFGATPQSASQPKSESTSESTSQPTSGAPAANNEPTTASSPAQAAAQSPGAATPAPRGQSSATKPATTTIRVDLDRVDRVSDMASEIAITQASVLQHLDEELTQANPELARGLEVLSQQTRMLQDAIMSIRAQPVKSVFSRMPRLIRQLEDEVGKKVKLDMLGENTEIDRTIIEQLADPLTHMIRNSVDHGIETPEEREKAGKPRDGTIVLSAEQVSGRIEIKIKDDGGGIRRDRVLKRARERGLVAMDAHPTDDEIDNLIFAPGFSTAETTSNISGRGVGMDVVRSNIERMGGRVSVRSTPGVGATILLSLPLTLAVLDVMLVHVGTQPYVVPLSSVIESMTLANAPISSLPSGESIVKFRGEYAPIVDLASVFGEAAGEEDSRFLIMCDAEGDRRLGVLVDAMLGQQQVAIKSLESNFGRVPGLAGATIMGDGRVALIVDVVGIQRMLGAVANETAAA